MITPVIIGPVVLPKVASPNVSECKTLQTYVNGLVSALENVQARINEISTDPDESLIVIKTQVEEMLADARKMSSQLENIRNEAAKNSSYNTDEKVMYF